MPAYLLPLNTNDPFTLRTLVLWLGVLLLVVCLSAYILYQARFLLLGPQIHINALEEITTSERVVELQGNAQNIARISLNGRQIFTDPEGRFNERVVLAEGYNILTIAGVDRYGRTSEVVQEYVYRPAI